MSKLHLPAGTATGGDDPLLITPELAGWRYTGLRVNALEPGATRPLSTGDCEMIVLPLSGACTVEVEGERFELRGRSDVFSAVSDFAYLPIGCQALITASAGGASASARAARETALSSSDEPTWPRVRHAAGLPRTRQPIEPPQAREAAPSPRARDATALPRAHCEFALASARAERRLPPAYGAAADVAVEVRGAGRATRQINNLFIEGTLPAHRLAVVEVLTPAGNWSSYPPHKHDDARVQRESELEEIYYFRIDGEHGFGLHYTYTSDGQLNETAAVRDGDVFLVPRGYHGPCAAAPDYAMYYLNVLAGPDADRSLACTDDPAYAWIRGAWADVPPDPRVPMTSATQ